MNKDTRKAILDALQTDEEKERNAWKHLELAPSVEVVTPAGAGRAARRREKKARQRQSTQANLWMRQRLQTMGDKAIERQYTHAEWERSVEALTSGQVKTVEEALEAGRAVDES